MHVAKDGNKKCNTLEMHIYSCNNLLHTCIHVNVRSSQDQSITHKIPMKHILHYIKVSITLRNSDNNYLPWGYEQRHPTAVGMTW